jgi:hypothetical protein
VIEGDQNVRPHYAEPDDTPEGRAAIPAAGLGRRVLLEFLPPVFFAAVIALRCYLETNVLSGRRYFAYYVLLHHGTWYLALMLGVLIAASVVLKRRSGALLWLMYCSVVMFMPLAWASITGELLRPEYHRASFGEIVGAVLTFCLSEDRNVPLAVELLTIFSSLVFVGARLTGSWWRGLTLAVIVHVYGNLIATSWFRPGRLPIHAFMATQYTFLLFGLLLVLFWQAEVFRSGVQVWRRAVVIAASVWIVTGVIAVLRGASSTYDAVVLGFLPVPFLFWGHTVLDARTAVSAPVKAVAAASMLLHLAVFGPIALGKERLLTTAMAAASASPPGEVATPIRRSFREAEHPLRILGGPPSTPAASAVSATTMRASVEHGFEYLQRHMPDDVGMSYVATQYPFAIKYPASRHLGRVGISGYLLEALRAFGARRQVDSLADDLLRRRQADGLWPFDEFRYSVDADTTLTVLLPLMEAGRIDPPRVQETLATLVRRFQDEGGFRSFEARGAHPNFGSHFEVTANVLTAMVGARDLGVDFGDAGRAAVTKLTQQIQQGQDAAGCFDAYWYPSPQVGTFRAVRALAALARRPDAGEPAGAPAPSAFRGALRCIVSTQNGDGGWGAGGSDAFETAHAMLSLSILAESGYLAASDIAAARASLARGAANLLATGRSDGSWPGATIFYFYYPQCPDRSCREEWHDRDRGLLSTAMAMTALSASAPIP